MPAKPAWYSRINEIINDLEALPRPFVDRTTVEFLLRVGRRRAQQILAPCVTDRVGTNGLADRDVLIGHLRRLSDGEDAYYERNRRKKVAKALEKLQKEALERPKLLVSAPIQVQKQEFESLPAGIQLAPGRITVEFSEPQEALEKLLALAMAIGRDFGRFERIVSQTDRSRVIP